MDRILDYLNKREIKANTFVGALKCLNMTLGKSLPTRYTHSLGVLEETKNLCKQLDLAEETKMLILKSAILHEVGYYKDFEISRFYPFDGYTYLKHNGWDDEICQVVLHHTNAVELAAYKHPELSFIYEDNILDSLSEQVQLAVKVVTIADMHVNSQGQKVPMKEKCEDVIRQYGENSHLTIHIIKTKMLVDEYMRELNIQQ